MNKFIGYTIVIFFTAIAIYWFIVPFLYFKKIPSFLVMVFSLIGYYSFGFFIWNRYKKRIIDWINDSDYFKHF